MAQDPSPHPHSHILRVERVFRLGRKVGQTPAGEGEINNHSSVACPPIPLSLLPGIKVMKPDIGLEGPTWCIYWLNSKSRGL